MNTGDLLAVLDGLAPARLAEDWDNVGLMVGRRDRPVTRVLVALDLRAAVLDEAEATGADLVLVHHPPIFPAMSAITDARTAGGLVLRAGVAQPHDETVHPRGMLCRGITQPSHGTGVTSALS